MNVALILVAGAPQMSATLGGWLPVLGGAAAGAVIAAVFGMVRSGIESNREHKRWLRERRFDAYVRGFGLSKGYDLNWSKTKKVADRIARDLGEVSDGNVVLEALKNDKDLSELDAQLSALHASAAEVLAPAVLLGPDSVTGPLNDMQLAYEADDKEAARRAEVDFRNAARLVLNVPSKASGTTKLAPAHVSVRIFFTVFGLALAGAALTMVFRESSALPLPLFAASVTLASLSITRRPDAAFAVTALPLVGSVILVLFPDGAPVTWMVFAAAVVAGRVIDVFVVPRPWAWDKM